MRKILNELYVGNEIDYRAMECKCWRFVLAAKEPWHREALQYTSRSAPKDSTEYLYAIRDNKLILNMVDAPSGLFFDKGMIDTALEYIGNGLKEGKTVMIACNKGESRSASLGLLYLIKTGHIKGETLEDCEAEYLKIYPEYNPGKGIREFMKEHLGEYKTN